MKRPGPPYIVKVIGFAHTRIVPGEGLDEGVLKGIDTTLDPTKPTYPSGSDTVTAIKQRMLLTHISDTYVNSVHYLTLNNRKNKCLFLSHPHRHAGAEYIHRYFGKQRCCPLQGMRHHVLELVPAELPARDTVLLAS